MGKTKLTKAKKIILIAICIFAVICGIISSLIFGEDTPMKKIFLSQVQTELEKCKIGNEILKEEEISNLPEPVQHYFKSCGYLGKEKMSSAEFIWGDVNFKMGVEKPWLKIKYQQNNFVTEPSRIAYIYSKMFGLIPFEGLDKYQGGQGNMLGKLLKKVTLFDVTGAEMNESAAVTFLSESLIVPTCALQPYIKWEFIDQNRAKAILEYKDIKVEGIFIFNDKGEFTKFETDNRYMDLGDGRFEKHKWTAVASNYIQKNDLKVPSKMKAIWNLPQGDFEYFDGTITEIIYNNKQKL
jgi:hypothetical protein